MPTNDSAQTFKCPSCGAPVEIEPGQSTMKCPYCSETIVIPASLRIPLPQQQPAPQIYVPAQTTFGAGSVPSTTSRPSFAGRIIAILALVVVLGVGAFFAFGFNPFGGLLFANKVMSFGGEGIGPGLFQDPRAIGVDGNGNIVVADSQDGRVQVFTPDGKFISTFTVTDPNSKPAGILSLAVTHDGKIYIPAGDIEIYDENGNQVGKIAKDMQHDYETVALGADGTLYALTFGDDNLVRFKPDGTIDLEVPDVVGSVTGESGGFPHLAVDGLGNIYIAVDTPPVILKFSPQGKFVDQFGGETKDSATFEPGKFVSPMGIAIDGYGRIYVNDFFNLQVFDSSGKYLNNISDGFYGIAFDEQNNLYTTPATQSDMVKFQVKKPVQ